MHGYPHLSVILFFASAASADRDEIRDVGAVEARRTPSTCISECRDVGYPFFPSGVFADGDVAAVLAVAGVKSNKSLAIPTKGKRLVDFETMWLAEP